MRGLHRARRRRRPGRRRRQLADRPRRRASRSSTSATPHPRVVAAVQEQVARVHPHLLHGHAVRRATSRCARRSTGSPRAATRSGRRCSTPAPRRWRTRSRSPGWRTGRDAVVVFDHAYHGRTNLTMAMTAKAMPYKHGFGPFAGEVYRAPLSYPFREPAVISGAAAAARAIDVHREAGRRRPGGLRRDRADPGRGRLRRAGAGLPAPRCPSGARPTASCSWPTRSRPASAAPARLFACEHEGVVPDLITTAKGIAGGLPLAALTGRAEIMDAVARRRPRRDLRRQPGRLRGRARLDRRRCASEDLPGRAKRHRVDDDPAARPSWPSSPADRRRARPRRDAGDRDRRARAPGRRTPAEAGRDLVGLPPAGRAHPDLRHLRQRAALPAAAVIPEALLDEALDVLAEALASVAAG